MISLRSALSGLFLVLLAAVTSSVFVTVFVNGKLASDEATHSAKLLLDKYSIFTRDAISDLADQVQSQLSEVVLAFIDQFFNSAIQACDTSTNLFLSILPTLQENERRTNNGSLRFDILNPAADNELAPVLRKHFTYTLGALPTISSMGFNRNLRYWRGTLFRALLSPVVPARSLPCSIGISTTDVGPSIARYFCINETTGDFMTAVPPLVLNNTAGGIEYVGNFAPILEFRPTMSSFTCRIASGYLLTDIISMNIGAYFYETSVTPDSLASVDILIGVSSKLTPFLLTTLQKSPLSDLHGVIIDASGSVLSTSLGIAQYQINATNPVTGQLTLVGRQTTLETANSSLLYAVAGALNRTYGGLAALNFTVQSRITLEVSDVDESLWFVSIVPYRHSRGVKWMIVLLVPRASVLGRVDVEAALHAAEQVKQERQVEERLRISGIVSVIVFTLGVCIAMLTAIVLASKLAAPLTKLATDMNLVATMQVEDSCFATMSVLSEVRTMQEAFNGMVRLLKHYKSFLPQTVLTAGEEEGDETADRPLLPGSTTRSFAGGVKKSRDADSQSRRSSTKSSTKVSSVGPKITDLGLVRRTVSVVAVCLVNFHMLASSIGMKDLGDIITDFANTLLEVAALTRGVADQFDLGRMAILYNASARNATHSVQAATAALHLTSRLKGLSEKYMTKAGKVGGLQFGIGSATAMDVCGNTGTDGMRRFQVIGCAKPTAERLAVACPRLGASNLCHILTYQNANAEVKGRMILSKVICPPYVDIPFMVAELKGIKEVAMDEWMYQLQSAEGADEWALYNVAAVAAMEHTCVGSTSDQPQLASSNTAVSQAILQLQTLQQSGSGAPVLEIPDALDPAFWLHRE